MSFVFGAELMPAQGAAACFARSAVVIGEEHEGILVHSMFSQGSQDSACAGIDLGDQGPHDVAFGFGQSRRGDHVGGVNGGVRNVAEKGLVLVLVDEVNGGIRYGIGDQGLAVMVGDMGHRFVSLDPGQGRVLSFRVSSDPHVVGIGNALVFVESLSQRHEGRLIAQMPLAEATGGVTRLLQDLCDGDFLRVQSPLVGREDHALSHSDTVRVTTRQECRSGRGAGGRTDVKVSQFHPLLGHAVEVRGGVVRSERTDVPVAHVVNEDDDDVGRCTNR